MRRIPPLVVLLVAATCLFGCSSSHTTTTTATSAGSGASGASSAGSGTSTASCPKSTAVSSAMGSTYTGPMSHANGTAGCAYDGPGTANVEILHNAPGLSQSQWASQAGPGGGATKKSLSGYGKAALISTAFGQSQVNVYVSPSDSFSVVVIPPSTAHAEALAHMVLAG